MRTHGHPSPRLALAAITDPHLGLLLAHRAVGMGLVADRPLAQLPSQPTRLDIVMAAATCAQRAHQLVGDLMLALFRPDGRVLLTAVGMAPLVVTHVRDVQPPTPAPTTRAEALGYLANVTRRSWIDMTLELRGNNPRFQVALALLGEGRPLPFIELYNEIQPFARLTIPRY